MTTTDTLLADLVDVLDRASKLAKDMAATLAGPSVDMLKPAYHPERDGTLGELEPGDRVMWDGQWREVGSVVEHDGRWSHIGLEPDDYIYDRAETKVRIQKRHGNVTIPDDPLRAYRLPSGRVAYETTYADEVKAGDWVQRCHGDPEWHQVTDRTLAHNTGGDMVRIGYADDNFYWWAPTDAIRVARLAADVVAAQDKTA